MTALAQALVGGILIGGLYVAISIGFSLSFGVLDVVDLAVGMWVVLGAFAAIVASDALGSPRSATTPAPCAPASSPATSSFSASPPR